MRLRDVFMLEGAHDAENRKLAQDAFDKLRAGLLSSPESAWKKEQILRYVNDTRTSWTLVPPATEGLPDDLSVHLAIVPEGKGFPEASFVGKGPNRPGGHIFIYVELTKDVYDRVLVDPVKARVTAHRNATKLLDHVRGEFIHEYTHYLDRKRMKGKVAPSSLSREKGKAAYFAHPFELNAFIQEMFDSFEHVVAQRPELMGLDANEFYKNFINHTKREQPAFYAYIRKRNIPRLKKRVAQLYQDLEDRTSG